MNKAKTTKQDKKLSVGMVADRSGLSVSALHFYESKGLINSSRNTGNQRRFSKDVLRRLAIIKVAQELGISLSEVSIAFNSLPEKRTPTTSDWEKLSRRWHTMLEERIRRLTLLKNKLDDCIGCGCLSINNCPLRNPEDKLGHQGSGAQLLK